MSKKLQKVLYRYMGLLYSLAAAVIILGYGYFIGSVACSVDSRDCSAFVTADFADAVLGPKPQPMK